MRIVLNDQKPLSNKFVGLASLVKELNKMILQIYGKYINEEGTGVDYEGIAKDRYFLGEYVDKASELPHASPDEMQKLSEAGKKAFFINLYNMMVIHAIGIPRQGFFATVSYNIAGVVFSCDDVEHGILRCNTAKNGHGAPPFSEDDSRLGFCLKTKDARVHFALVCGARSCPPIRIFDEENVDRALDLATRAFVANNTTVDFEKSQVKLSKLFEWYDVDFGASTQTVCAFLLRHSDGQLAEALTALLQKKNHFTLFFEPYDWSLNSLQNILTSKM